MAPPRTGPHTIYDVLGIGLGPSNLAPAIAVDEHNAGLPEGRGLDALSLERQPGFGWHRGMLIDDATMQVSFLEDLVTMRDPAGDCSFLRFLRERGRLVDFLNQKTLFALRLEFHDYFEWAADGLGVEVEFLPTGEREVLAADILVHATGYRPRDNTGLLGESAKVCLRDDGDALRMGRDHRVAVTPDVLAGICLQGGTENRHGLTSTLLSTTAVRAGEIRDSLLAARSCQPVRAADFATAASAAAASAAATSAAAASAKAVLGASDISSTPPHASAVREVSGGSGRAVPGGGAGTRSSWPTPR